MLLSLSLTRSTGRQPVERARVEYTGSEMDDPASTGGYWRGRGRVVEARSATLGLVPPLAISTSDRVVVQVDHTYKPLFSRRRQALDLLPIGFPVLRG